MIERLLPAAAACAETCQPGDAAAGESIRSLFPAEYAHVAAAVASRRREFAVVRSCARLALAELGLPPCPLLPGERGATRWPSGIVGSMTHCDGYCAAAVAPSAAVHAIGIDAEADAPLPGGVLEVVALPAERERLDLLARTEPGVCWDRLLFSAKESVYKAWYPRTRRWLGFSQAEITLRTGGTFTVQLRTDRPEDIASPGAASGPAALIPSTAGHQAMAAGLTGRWLADRGLVITAVSARTPPARSLDRHFPLGQD